MEKRDGFGSIPHTLHRPELTHHLTLQLSVVTWRSGCTAIRTTLAPEREANELSANCWEMVHGMRSPDARLPRDRLFITEP